MVLEGVTYSFSPKRGASSRDIRVNGALCVGAGFVVLLTAVGVMLVVPPRWSAHVLLVPSLIVYATWLIGGYRLVFGASADSVGSWVRIIFGIVFIVAMFGLLIGGVLLIDGLVSGK